MLFVAIVLIGLTAALVVPPLLETARTRRAERSGRSRARDRERVPRFDPGRERRAEQRARELLRSCVNEEEWAMYRDLGFIRVHGRSRADSLATAAEGALAQPLSDENEAELLEPGSREQSSSGAAAGPADSHPPGARRRLGRAARTPQSVGYAFLLYPHKPLLAYEPGTHRLLSEYCVEFPDLSDAVTGSRLPDSDDVLAKWMALTGDEARLLRDANMHLPGRQLDPARVRRDLWRLGEWERRRSRSADDASSA